MKSGDRVWMLVETVTDADVDGSVWIDDGFVPGNHWYVDASDYLPAHPALPTLAAILAEEGGAERLAGYLRDAMDWNAHRFDTWDQADECAALAAAIRDASGDHVQ